MEKTSQITFKDFITVLKDRIVWILVAALLLGCACAVGAKFLIKDQYTCSATYVLGDANISSTEYSQLKRNAQITQKTLESTEVIREVAEKANIAVVNKKGESRTAVNEMKKATSVIINNDVGFTVKVTTENPEISYRMVKSFEENMEDIAEKNRLYAAHEIGSAIAPTSPSNGSRSLKYGLIGFAAGAVLVYAIFLLKKFTDIKIYTTDDIAEVTDIPVIGCIPTYSAEQSSAGSHGKS